MTNYRTKEEISGSITDVMPGDRVILVREREGKSTELKSFLIPAGTKAKLETNIRAVVEIAATTEKEKAEILDKLLAKDLTLSDETVD